MWAALLRVAKCKNGGFCIRKADNDFSAILTSFVTDALGSRNGLQRENAGWESLSSIVIWIIGDYIAQINRIPGRVHVLHHAALFYR